MSLVNKEDLTEKELNSLCPTYGLFNGVIFEEVQYYKDNETGTLVEVSWCLNDSWDKRMEQIEKAQKVSSLLGSFGLI